MKTDNLKKISKIKDGNKIIIFIEIHLRKINFDFLCVIIILFIIFFQTIFLFFFLFFSLFLPNLIIVWYVNIIKITIFIILKIFFNFFFINIFLIK